MLTAEREIIESILDAADATSTTLLELVKFANISATVESSKRTITVLVGKSGTGKTSTAAIIGHRMMSNSVNIACDIDAFCFRDSISKLWVCDINELRGYLFANSYGINVISGSCSNLDEVTLVLTHFFKAVRFVLVAPQHRIFVNNAIRDKKAAHHVTMKNKAASRIATTLKDYWLDNSLRLGNLIGMQNKLISTILIGSKSTELFPKLLWLDIDAFDAVRFHLPSSVKSKLSDDRFRPRYSHQERLINWLPSAEHKSNNVMGVLLALSMHS